MILQEAQSSEAAIDSVEAVSQKKRIYGCVQPLVYEHKQTMLQSDNQLKLSVKIYYSDEERFSEFVLPTTETIQSNAIDEEIQIKVPFIVGEMMKSKKCPLSKVSKPIKKRKPKSEKIIEASSSSSDSESQEKMADSSQQTSKQGKDKWTKKADLEYFKSVLRIKTEFPDSIISWRIWKINGYYPKMASYMQKANFKKTVWQCKTKDQNFKTFYYLKRNSPIDLVPLSLKIVLQEISRLTALNQETIELCEIVQKYNQECGSVQEQASEKSHRHYHQLLTTQISHEKDIIEALERFCDQP